MSQCLRQNITLVFIHRFYKVIHADIRLIFNIFQIKILLLVLKDANAEGHTPDILLVLDNIMSEVGKVPHVASEVILKVPQLLIEDLQHGIISLLRIAERLALRFKVSLEVGTHTWQYLRRIKIPHFLGNRALHEFLSFFGVERCLEIKSVELWRLTFIC